MSVNGKFPESSLRLILTLLLLIAASPVIPLFGVPANIGLSQSAQVVDAYDFVEITLNITSSDAKNPFTDVTVKGQFGQVGDSKRLSVDGFCDSADGTVFRIRFMPSAPGDYAYSIAYRQGDFEKTYKGTFRASTATGEARYALTPSIPGISSGRVRRALFLQRHDGILAHGLAR